jgi:tRNA (cmo5U34)-methyltransferase
LGGERKSPDRKRRAPSKAVIMNKEQVKEIFDRQASGYDEQWKRTAPIKDGLLFLLTSVFAVLPSNARLLCVGAGTGEEMVYLARRFPQWSFVVVEPSGAMLDVCRQKADAEGFAARCRFHQGYVSALPMEHQCDAATCFLVSQFMLDRQERAGFFREIAARLRPGGMLASSDLASDPRPDRYEALLHVWWRVMSAAGLPEDGLQRMRVAYEKDVAVLAPHEVEAVIEAGGFHKPVKFYQAGLIHAWFSTKAPEAGS